MSLTLEQDFFRAQKIAGKVFFGLVFEYEVGRFLLDCPKTVGFVFKRKNCAKSKMFIMPS